ncbi:L-aspartate oxidase [Coriobacteriia bacterium Es71-Z0120]|uniref:L-aspartate oxidase n=1 Tax=Parvivirga hydrogeniphila TaxID=2939460 RepID=UPI002260B7F7|nr:L-aspartate oxidase [Parvivirga hydrogeniphila]MCL4079403.1 L-aspartate oxidase [Parvivirga hydrogeniphila]
MSDVDAALDLGPLDRRYLLPFDTQALPERRCDVLVVGSGIAGLVAALHAAAFSKVLLVTKARLSETNTWYAQGGIAGAVGEADSVELHIADTLVVGQGLCDPDVVRAVVSEAPEALAELETLGVAFDRAADGSIALAREGGHSLPRVLHSGDATGAEVQDTLTAVARSHAGIEILEEAFLVDLLTEGGRCVGALVLERGAREPVVVWAGATVLATGGCGQIYRVTTNPEVATGDGVAAAWRAGALVADLEFVQFHPTALDSGANPKFLITEALRGEGAYLLDCDERRFMLDAHPLAELAPRDVVSREIERVMARCGRPNVWLDARHLGKEFLKQRFPTIWRACREAGFDLARDLVPVAPAAHYMVGGVLTDRDGRSSLPGLFASGEAAATGLHGANRLASNSLLEGLVFSRRIARVLEKERPRPSPLRIVGAVDGDTACGTALVRGRVQRLMSERVGVTRSEEGLAAACDELARLASTLGGPALDAAAMESRNLVTVAALIACAARTRTESRGTHYRADFPARDDERWRHRLAWRRGEAEPVRIAVARGEQGER